MYRLIHRLSFKSFPAVLVLAHLFPVHLKRLQSYPELLTQSLSVDLLLFIRCLFIVGYEHHGTFKHIAFGVCLKSPGKLSLIV